MRTIRGVRFAPSPTGRFHIGNLRTAWISWRWAKALKQPWILRFEDIDTPRVLAGARERQIEDMRALGLEADEICDQSQLRTRHWELFKRARSEGRIYACNCSRKEVMEGLASAPHGGAAPVYTGKCRNLHESELSHDPFQPRPSLGWRFKVEVDPSGKSDFLIARTEWTSEPRERTFVPAYAWACAIDDLDGDYALLVRAWDLEHALAQQREIQRWMVPGAALPAVFHTALVTSNDGHRLEKRTQGVTWPELESAGMRPATLIAAFERSFEFKHYEFKPSLVWGEARRTMALSALGL